MYGITPKKIELNVETGSVSIKFDRLKNIPKEELGIRQNELERKLDNIQRRLSDTLEGPEIPEAQATYNLSGRWQSNDGSFYDITQYGPAVTIQQISPIYGVTAIGSGEVAGNTINLEYATSLYTYGEGNLELNTEKTTMTAVWNDYATGFVSRSVLYR